MLIDIFITIAYPKNFCNVAFSFGFSEISKGVGRFRDLLQAVEVRGLNGLRQVRWCGVI